MRRTTDRNNEKEKKHPVTIQDAALQPQKNHIWKNIPTKVICCTLILLVLAAGTVVLSLIIVYLPKKDWNESNIIRTISTVNVTYRSNLAKTNSLMVADPDALSADLMQELNLTGIIVRSAAFVQSSTKRQAAEIDNTQCEKDSCMMDNLFNIEFSITHPQGCVTDLCQEDFTANVQSNIVNEHPKINLAIPFTNGQTLIVEFSFYSFNSISTGNLVNDNWSTTTNPPSELSYLSVTVGITRIVVNSPTHTTAPSESLTFGGRIFGNVGAYEKLRGTAYGQLDHDDTHNHLITDLKYAPRNNAGMVEYSMDFYILKPVNLSNSNHKLFFEVNNRGDKQFGPFSESSQNNNPSTADDAGQAFLMNQGYIIAWSGWDPSVSPTGSPDLLRIYLPTAINSDGSSITGPSYEYIVFDNPTSTSYTTLYKTNSTDTTKATLTVKDRLTDLPVTIPSTNWTWISSNQISLLPVNTTFKQSSIYELVYTAKDPSIAGIGFVATRDFVSFLRSVRTDNPLAGDITRVVAWSLSQPARYMNDFIWLGFNVDLNGKQVFDGVFNWIGAGTGVVLNYRFAQPARTERNRQNHLYPEASFPFSYTILTDSLTGKTDGRNRRCIQTSTCPKIMNINSANEYWVKAGSLLHSDLSGNDLIDPPNVRYFLISGTQHGTPSAANSLGICQQFGNTVDPNPALRALFIALDQWLDGTEPPASMVPRHSDGTAVLSNITDNSALGIGKVPQTSLNWSTIPDVLYTGLITVRNLFNFGPQFNEGIISINPPNSTGLYYPSSVSKVDTDGNELAGIRLPPVAVPLATYTGWNLRHAAYGGNDGCELTGSVIPFAPDMATRTVKGDTRLSLAERYGNHSSYVTAVIIAANALANQRLLLPADVQAYITAAQASIQIINNPVYGNYTW